MILLLEVFISIQTRTLKNLMNFFLMIFLINYPQKRLSSWWLQHKPSKLWSRHIIKWISWFSLFTLIYFHIFQPTRVRGNSKTLIDSVFSNAISPNVIPDKLTSSTSDHLPQFLKAPNIFFNPTSSKSKMYERDWTKFDQ